MTRTTVFGAALAIGLGLVAFTWALPERCPRTYTVGPASDPAPRIDGVTSAEEWPSEGWESGLVFPWREEPAPVTAFVARADDTGLSFAFRVEDGDVVIVEGDSGDESLVARGDRVELFFALDAALEDYYSIEIDPIGRVLDYRARYYRRFDDAWDCPGLEVAGRVRPGGYDVEGRIPLRAFEEMGFAGSMGTILTGVFRGEFSRGDGDEILESWISWVDPRVPEPDFHVPSAFGCFRLPWVPRSDAEVNE